MYRKFIGEAERIPCRFDTKLLHICVVNSTRTAFFFADGYLVYNFRRHEVEVSRRQPQNTYRCLLTEPVDDTDILLYNRTDYRLVRLNILTNELVELSKTSRSQSADQLLVFR